MTEKEKRTRQQVNTFLLWGLYIQAQPAVRMAEQAVSLIVIPDGDYPSSPHTTCHKPEGWQSIEETPQDTAITEALAAIKALGWRATTTDDVRALARGMTDVTVEALVKAFLSTVNTYKYEVTE